MDSGNRSGSDAINVTIAPPPPPPGTVAVTSIAYESKGGRNHDKNLFVDAFLRDENGNPVSGATITLVITPVTAGSSPATFTGVTDANGQASMMWKNAPGGCYESTVTSVTATGMTWDGATPPNSSCP
jgi:hypothetical protein